MNNVTIRTLSLLDLDEFYTQFSHLVSTQFDEYSQKTRRHMLTAPHLWTKESYKAGLQNDRKMLLGAFVNGKIVGLIDSTFYGGGVAFCGWLMVHPEYQKKGIGKSLLKKFEDISKEKGCHCVFLYASRHNIPYYEKMRYKQSGVFEKGWFGNTDYLFTKILQEPKEENFLR